MPKIIAFVSTSMKPRITFCWTTNRKPSTIEPRLGDEVPPSGLSDGSSHTATSVPKNVTVSITYAVVTPVVAIRTPASAGPATAPRLELRPLRLFAATSCSSATRRGKSECCAPAPNANADDSDEGAEEARPRLRVRRRGVRDGDRGADDHPALLDQHQLAAVERVRERAADERHRQHRDQLGECEQADGERRVRQRVHLVRQRDVADLAADERRGLREPEAAERLGVTQRRPVELQLSQQLADAGRLEVGRAAGALAAEGAHAAARVRRAS